MRMMRYFSSQEVPQLEDGCRSHRQATYVTWTCWSARMEVTFLHNDKAFRKPNAMHGYFLKWYDLGKILSWLSLWQRRHDSCRLLPKCLLQTKRTCHWGSFQLSSMMDSYIAFLTPTPGWPTPTPSSFHTLIHPHWHTQCCTRLTRRGKKKFGVQKLSDLTQTSAFHSSAQTGSRWCRKKYGFRLELKGHMMLMNVKKKVWYNVNSDACSAPTGRFVKWQGQNTARSKKKVNI